MASSFIRLSAFPSATISPASIHIPCQPFQELFEHFVLRAALLFHGPYSWRGTDQRALQFEVLDLKRFIMII